MPLWAVHLSDGVLSTPYLVLGFVGAGVLVGVSLRGVADDEIPRIGLLTAAFFVASLIHVKVGITSVHLLLNGLVGAMLGWRAPLALAVALALQALLLGHGGYTTLGLNVVIMALPALASWAVFRWLCGRSQALAVRAFWGGLVVGAMAVVLTAVLYAAVLLAAGVEDFRLVASLGFVAHLPLAGIEAVITATTCASIARARPQLLATAGNNRPVTPPPESV
ncbi:MAG: CbiM family transporter [Nitrospira sp.]|nr:CbiM family transporter [Nitrospira sp.]